MNFHLLDPLSHSKPVQGKARAAAVLIPIVMHDAPTVLLTRRSLNLPVHAGQISFAGGKVDAGDTSALHAALREAHEEIGLLPENVTPIGQLGHIPTRTGFDITAIIATIPPNLSYKLNIGETDEVFEVPLAHLLDPEKHLWRSRIFMGRERYYYAIPYKNYYIWGVTAGIIRQLYERLHPC
jgi:8-oxo-dGTP pyrophosphatase MutT (NUDIX family)